MPELIESTRLDDLLVTRKTECERFDERAQEILGETPGLRKKCLNEFRNRLGKVEDFKPKMDDDIFLMRFLRAKKFNVDKAYKLLCNFYSVRLLKPKLYVPIGKGPKDFKHLYDLECGVLMKHRNPIDGAAVAVCKFGKWRPESGAGPLDIYSPAVYIAELIMDNPEVQLNGFHFIIDIQGLELNWIFRYCTPDYIMSCLGWAQETYPMRVRGLHVLHQGTLWNIAYAIAKPFLPKKVKERCHLHGSDYESLHKLISSEVLPAEYGGDQPPMDIEWFTEDVYEMHDRIVKESYYGYDVE